MLKLAVPPGIGVDAFLLRTGPGSVVPLERGNVRATVVTIVVAACDGSDGRVRGVVFLGHVGLLSAFSGDGV
jgi:hypothetical protein